MNKKQMKGEEVDHLGICNLCDTLQAVLLGSLCGLAAITSFLVPVLTSSETGIFAHALIMGLVMGSSLVLLGPVVIESVRPEHIPTAYGVCFMSVGVGNISLQIFSSEMSPSSPISWRR